MNLESGIESMNDCWTVFKSWNLLNKSSISAVVERFNVEKILSNSLEISDL